MKKKESAYARIKDLISKTAKEEIENEKRNHSYRQEEDTPIPSGIENISLRNTQKSSRPLGKAKVILQKPTKSALEQMHCTQNQNYPLFFIEKAEALQMRKVKNVKVKERFIATRSLKKLSHSMQRWMHKEVSILGQHSEEFYALLQKREERHFQIDRIIKYLSDM